MKNTILSFVTIMFMFGAITTSCDNAANREDTAKENVRDAREDLREAQQDVRENSGKVANAEEWKLFKAETDVKIKANEVRIAELKSLKSKQGKGLDDMYEKNIDALEKRNAELRAKRDNYESNQSDWESFKREFNHDMDELGKSLENISVDNRK